MSKFLSERTYTFALVMLLGGLMAGLAGNSVSSLRLALFFACWLLSFVLANKMGTPVQLPPADDRLHVPNPDHATIVAAAEDLVDFLRDNVGENMPIDIVCTGEFSDLYAQGVVDRLTALEEALKTTLPTEGE